MNAVAAICTQNFSMSTRQVKVVQGTNLDSSHISSSVYTKIAILTWLFYKNEVSPIEIDSKSKLSRIIGQRARGKNKKRISEVLVKNKRGKKAKWIDLNKFISE